VNYLRFERVVESNWGRGIIVSTLPWHGELIDS